MRTGVVLVAMLAACSAGTGGMSSDEARQPTRAEVVSCVDPEANPATVLSEPEIAQSSDQAANLVLQVTNSASSAAHLVVELDDRVAVDSLLPPANDAACIEGPIYQYFYRPEPGRMTVTVTREGETPQSLTFDVVPDRRWVVIDAQDGFPVEPRLWKEEPQWG